MMSGTVTKLFDILIKMQFSFKVFLLQPDKCNLIVSIDTNWPV